ncbi:MAG: hypothetical protein GVY17_12885, partial [Cyanobacteria bacterium]|nr:hypothetical protein [Cyanobacteria bacterium GSL.Bin21]
MEFILKPQPLTHYTTDILNQSTSLLNLTEQPSEYLAILNSVETQLSQQLINWFSQEDFLTQAAIPFSATAGSSTWIDNALALQNSILTGTYSINLEVLSASEMEGALGAYSPTGTTNEPTIYLNEDWLATAANEEIITVLVEELGHDFDRHINGSFDSQGDEGQLFANLAFDQALSEQELVSILNENDNGLLTIDGQDIAVEFNISVTQTDDSATLLNSLLGSDPANFDGITNISLTTSGDPRGFGTFTNDPFGLDGGVVISTGAATNVEGPNNDEGDINGTDFGNDGNPDTITLTITFDLDAEAQGVFLTYVFGSEEFPEFAQAGFNDNFTINFNGTNVALLSDGNEVSIDNLVATQNDPSSGTIDYIDNNTDGSNGSLTDDTQLDGYTKILFAVALPSSDILNLGGSNTITITIEDVGDGLYDSAAFFQAGSLGTTPPIITTIDEDSNDDGVISGSELSGDIEVTVSLPNDA